MLQAVNDNRLKLAVRVKTLTQPSFLLLESSVALLHFTRTSRHIHVSTGCRWAWKGRHFQLRFGYFWAKPRETWRTCHTNAPHRKPPWPLSDCPRTCCQVSKEIQCPRAVSLSPDIKSKIWRRRRTRYVTSNAMEIPPEGARVKLFKVFPFQFHPSLYITSCSRHFLDQTSFNVNYL